MEKKTLEGKWSFWKCSRIHSQTTSPHNRAPRVLELLVGFLQWLPSTQPPVYLHLCRSLRSSIVSSTMCGFHHQSGCKEESGWVSLCEVIAQLLFAQHRQHPVSNMMYETPADAFDFVLPDCQLLWFTEQQQKRRDWPGTSWLERLWKTGWVQLINPTE